MTYLVEVPVEGGSLVVEAGAAQLPGTLDLAARRPGEIVAQASQALEQSLERLKPAVTAISRSLKSISPDSFTVEFGVVLGAECGIVVAKGTSEAHLNITLSWRGGGGPEGRRDGGADSASGDGDD
jgi:Trypsin-co-occurring domain 1